MVAANDPWDQYLDYLQEHGKLTSGARLRVFDAISSGAAEFTAEELTLRLKHHPDLRLSRVTVYRTCQELADAGLLWTSVIAGRVKYHRAW